MADTIHLPTPGARTHAWAFAKAVAAGSLAGAGPMMLLTVPLGMFFILQDTSSNLLDGLKMMFLPLMVSAPVVLASSVLVGRHTDLSRPSAQGPGDEDRLCSDRHRHGHRRLGRHGLRDGR